MSSATLVSLEEYLSRADKPLAEYVDGAVHLKSVPTKLHALIQFLLVSQLRAQGMDALSEVSVRVSERRILIPDVIADATIESPYPTTPVRLCCEVLSPEDRLSAAFAKCEAYHAWGVPFCWVIDPVKQTAWEYHAGSDPVRMPPDSSLQAGDLRVPVVSLFSEKQS